jgi:hypothetical protein
MRRVLAALMAVGRSMRAPAPPPDGADLVVCLSCGADCACPIDWRKVDDTHRWIRLRCGACGVWCDVVVDRHEAAELDRELDLQAAEIERSVRRLDRRRMESELATLIRALERDLIDPSSFAGGQA